MSCQKCDGPSRSGLCQSCQFDEEREFYERRAEEMADADRSRGESGGD